MNQMLNSAIKNLKQKLSIGGLDANMRFSVDPMPGDSGFNEWHDAMRMVARLPGGIPDEFRRKLWFTMAEKYLESQKINWGEVSLFCLNADDLNPEEESLGTQIIYDLHRTGCSLFSGQDSEHNQALLKQMLLGFARWNRGVGYCQGFNMLAAIILEVMSREVEDSLKVMVYLIERVLPPSYFANSLRGLSVDMAVLRDLLRMRLPNLSKHLDKLQIESSDPSTGIIYEPPLINVFTMQWFLTLFSNCLPKASVLRIWDLIFLEGNEVLIRTALAIWACLEDRIINVKSADEFYSIMNVFIREIMEFGFRDTNELINIICTMAPFPFPQLNEIREKYTFNIRPLTSLIKKRVSLLRNDDDDEDCTTNQIMMASWWLSSSLFNNRTEEDDDPASSGLTNFRKGVKNLSITDPKGLLSILILTPQKMTQDISLLKKQYAKLRERQRQAKIIITEGFQASSKNTLKKTQSSVTISNLLKGKTALVNKKASRPCRVGQIPKVDTKKEYLKRGASEDSGSRASIKALNDEQIWKDERMKRRESTPTHHSTFNQSISKGKRCDNYVTFNSESDEIFKSDTNEGKKINVFHSNDDIPQVISEKPISNCANLDSHNKMSYNQTNESSDNEIFKKSKDQIENEILNLSVEECIQKLNEKMSTFIENNYEAT